VNFTLHFPLESARMGIFVHIVCFLWLGEMWLGEILMGNSDSASTLFDLRSSTDEFLDDVLTGLRSSPKQLPSKYLYDQRGSRLFDDICLLDEYYLTRSEDQIIVTLQPSEVAL